MPIPAYTPFAELNQVLAALVARIQKVLGKDLLGIYLQGSFAVGDFDEHSDVDFIVVTRRDLTESQVHALQAVHARVYELDSEWAKHLEGSYLLLDVLARADRCDVPLWYLNHGSKELVRSRHCNTIVVRSVLRNHGIVLVGPPCAELVPPIRVADLRAEILTTAREWGTEILEQPDRYRNRFYQGFIVLSYCRMLHDFYAGAVGSKRAGAEWARHQLDRAWQPLIDRAWSCRPDPARSVRQPPDPADFQSTLAFVRYALEYARTMELR